MRLSAAIAAGFLLVLSAGAQNPQAPGGARGGGGFVAYPQRPIADPEAVARGKVMFDVNCSFCHGADARGGDDGPNLLRSELVLEDQKGENIGPVLLNGRDRGIRGAGQLRNARDHELPAEHAGAAVHGGCAVRGGSAAGQSRGAGQ